MKTKKVFIEDFQKKDWFAIYDSRFSINPERSTVFEVCETLKEARINAKEYGDNNVIVKVNEGGEIIKIIGIV